MTNALAILAPVGRVLIALIFLFAGIMKLGDPAGNAAYVASGGLPGWFVWPALVLEIVASVALIVGYRARIAALALAAFSLVAGLLYHLVPSMSAEGMEAMTQSMFFWKDVAIAGGLFMIAAQGAGAWSLDNRVDPQ